MPSVIIKGTTMSTTSSNNTDEVPQETIKINMEHYNQIHKLKNENDEMRQ